MPGRGGLASVEGMSARALLVVLVVFGCGPQKTGDDASGGSSAGTTQGSTSADPTVGGEDPCPDDATRCTDFCLNLLAHGGGCSRADVTCFDWCTRGFRFVEEEGCGAEFRAVYRTQIIVLKRPVDPSDDPNDVEFLFQEVLRVDVPAGSKVGPAAP